MPQHVGGQPPALRAPARYAIFAARSLFAGLADYELRRH